MVRISSTVDDLEHYVEDAMPTPPKKELLPAKYNRESEITLEIPSGAGRIEQNFDFYESNQFSGQDHLRWIVPLVGNRARLAEFLKTSNIEACFPVRASNAFAGFDNHSFRGNYNVYDTPGRPL